MCHRNDQITISNLDVCNKLLPPASCGVQYCVEKAAIHFFDKIKKRMSCTENILGIEMLIY